MRELRTRYLIRGWVKAVIAARDARKQKKLVDAHRFLQEALNRANDLPHQWKIRAIAYNELAALLSSEGNYAEADHWLGPALRPKRFACGSAGLRFGPSQ